MNVVLRVATQEDDKAGRAFLNHQACWSMLHGKPSSLLSWEDGDELPEQMGCA